MGLRDDIRKYGTVAIGALGGTVQSWAGGQLAKAKTKDPRDNDKEAQDTPPQGTKAPPGVQGGVDDVNDSERIPGGNREESVEGSPVPTQKATEDPKSLFWDPFAIIEQLGYKDRPSSITYGTLKAMVWKMPIVQAIILTRINQVASFSRVSHDRYQLGFKFQLRDSKKEPSPAESAWIEKMEGVFCRTGVTDNPRGRNDFETLLRKLTRDSMTYDQMCMEIVPNRKNEPAEWYAVDAATIRLADSSSTHFDEDDLTAIRTVQIYDSMIIAEYTQEEMCFGIRNPQTDIRLFGYGVSELEMLVSTITSLLYAWDYNQKFFCVSGDTLVTTKGGMKTIESLADQKFEILDGYSGVHKATAFETGIRPVVKTVLWNGLEIKTSPEHKFRVVPKDSETGKAEWREQKELVSGDVVLVSIEEEFGALDLDQFKVGKEYKTDRLTGRDFIPTKELVQDTEFWEMIGFALGDGHWPDLSKRTIHELQIFPHYLKDAELFYRFKRVLDRHGIHYREKTINKTIQRSDGEMGYPALGISQRSFVEWLYDIGFTSSTQGKCVATLLFAQPIELRRALLRGLFSADGCTVTHIAGYRTPTVHSSDSCLRQDILRCLFSVGVAANVVGKGPNRHGTITVQNVDHFVATIGYLQPYKNANIERDSSAKSRWDKLHKLVGKNNAESLYHIYKENEDMDHMAITIPSRGLEMLRKAGRGACGISRTYLRDIYEGMEWPCPEELVFSNCPVDYIEVTGDTELMYDVEVFNDRHQFLSNFMATHNSQGSAAKGIINFKGAVPERQLQGFRRQWYNMISGAENMWRTPITNSDELQYINLQQSSRDMEFNAWMDFLIKVACSVYSIDPVEVNFQYGNVGQKSSLGTDNNVAKITESKERGLRPLLRFLENQFNRHIVWPINENFEFAFVGLDAKTADEVADLNAKRVKSTRTVDELRAEDDLPPLPDGLGEIILDPVFMQNKQLAEGVMPEAGGPGGFGDDAGEDDGDGDGDATDYEKMLAQYESDENDDAEAADEEERSKKKKALEKAMGKTLEKAREKGEQNWVITL